MPMFTTSVIGLPVYPVHAPLRTASVNSRMCFSTAFTSGMTSLPSTRIGRFERFRRATCSTARSSVVLIFWPVNIFSVHPLRSACVARLRSSRIVSSVTRFLLKSSRMSSNERENLPKRLGSSLNSSRMCRPAVSLWCDCSACQAGDWVRVLMLFPSQRWVE